MLSTLSLYGAADPQVALARAAKKTGVRLFAPSEYGYDSDSKSEIQHDGLKAKSELYRHLKGLGLPWVKFFTGLWADFGLP